MADWQKTACCSRWRGFKLEISFEWGTTRIGISLLVCLLLLIYIHAYIHIYIYIYIYFKILCVICKFQYVACYITSNILKFADDTNTKYLERIKIVVINSIYKIF